MEVMFTALAVVRVVAMIMQMMALKQSTLHTVNRGTFVVAKRIIVEVTNPKIIIMAY